jgi:hypothetical protein
VLSSGAHRRSAATAPRSSVYAASSARTGASTSVSATSPTDSRSRASARPASAPGPEPGQRASQQREQQARQQAAEQQHCRQRQHPDLRRLRLGQPQHGERVEPREPQRPGDHRGGEHGLQPADGPPPQRGPGEPEVRRGDGPVQGVRQIALPRPGGGVRSAGPRVGQPRRRRRRRDGAGPARRVTVPRRRSRAGTCAAPSVVRRRQAR